MNSYEELVKEAEEVLRKRMQERGGIPVRYIIFKEETRDGVTIRLKGVIFEEEFIPSYKFLGVEND